MILKGTAKEPGDRYQSAATFAADLERAMNNDAPTIVRAVPGAFAPSAAPTIVRPDTGSEGATVIQGAAPGAAQQAEALPPVRKSKLPMIAIGLLVLLLAIGGAYLFLGSGAEPAAETSAGSPAETVLQTPPGEANGVANDADLPAETALQTPPGKANSVASNADSPAYTASPTPPGGAGDVVSDTVIYAWRDEIGANQPMVESVALKAGDVVFLDVHDTASPTDFTLTTPNGRDQVFSSYSDSGPFAVSADGAYSFSMATRDGKPGMVDIELLKLDPPVIAGGLLNSGSFVEATTQLPGQVVSYTMDLTQGDSVFFDVTRSEGTTDFTLRTPDGRTEVFSNYGNSGPHEIKKTGTYSLTADPRGDQLGDFEFSLYRLDPAVIDGGAIELNKYFGGETFKPGQLVAYSVNLTAGDVIYLDVAEASNTTDFVLTNPDGRGQVFSNYGDIGPIAVSADGEYRLTATPRGRNLSKFEATLYRLDPPEIAGGAVTLGKTISGATTMPGQTVAYSVELEGGGVVKLSVLKASSTSDFTLTAPGGSEVFSSYNDTNDIPLTETGTYTLTVVPRSAAVTQFDFVLLEGG